MSVVPEEVQFISEPVTPKSDRKRSTWGSLLMSAQTVPGLCVRGRKCVFKHGHASECWPKG